jgi:hypothetical protein
MKSAGAQGQKREQGRAKLLKTKEKKRLDSRARKGVGLSQYRRNIMNFLQGQKVWTPEYGWVKFERALIYEPDMCYVTRAGNMLRARLSTVAAVEYNQRAAKELVPYVRGIYITCQPSVIDALARWMSENSSLSETSAIDYIRPTTEASHGAKFDITVDPMTPHSLVLRLGVPLDSRNLAGWLMKEHNILPVKQV